MPQLRKASVFFCGILPNLVGSIIVAAMPTLPPLLLVDIGNSNLVLDLYADGTWSHTQRHPTATALAAFGESQKVLTPYIRDWQRTFPRLRHAVVSSVVPSLTANVGTLLTALGLEVTVIGPALYSALPVQILNPNEMGTDLVANAVQAHHLYPTTAKVVVDLGTALTFTTVSATGEVLGVAIAPGLQTAVKALFHHAAQLPEVPLALPPSALGRNTTQAVQAGIVLGYAHLIAGMIASIRTELGTKVMAIGTGGLSHVMQAQEGLFDYTDKRLTLMGMVRIWAAQQQPNAREQA